MLTRLSRWIAWYLPRKRPPRVTQIGSVGGGTRYNSGVVQKRQSIEITQSFPTEPNRPRFAWFETKAILRLEIGSWPVSEVRSLLLNPFEIKRNFGAQIGGWGVRNLIVAEGMGLTSNLLQSKSLFHKTIENSWHAASEYLHSIPLFHGQ